MKFLLFLFFTLIGIYFNGYAMTEAQKYRLDLIKRQDELLELLLQIPFEQRQYIFPMLSSEQTMPKKIRTHPEVVLWKGKKPTRLAEKFKNDSILINDLPEQFYYFLSPEMWPTKEEEKKEVDPHKILQNMISEYAYPSIQTQVMPEELAVLYSGLQILNEWESKQNLRNSNLYFEEKIKKLPEDIRKKLEKQTDLSADIFARKVDLIAQNYRHYQKQKRTLSSPEQRLVQEYWSLIPVIFSKTGFSTALNPELYSD